MDTDESEVHEQTVLIIREVSLYKVPPRAHAAGFKCGGWLVEDKIWGGRMRVMVVGQRCEIRLEDTTSGQLYAVCPVMAGMRDAAVEAAQDSSRYFIIRVESETGRHAFLGLGFADRHEAFDFNVALSDFDRHAKAESRHDMLSGTDQPDHTHHDFSLKEGQMIHVDIPGKATAQSSRTCIKSEEKVYVRAPPLVAPPTVNLFKHSPPVSSFSPETGKEDPFVALAARPSAQTSGSPITALTSASDSSNVGGSDPFGDFRAQGSAAFEATHSDVTKPQTPSKQQSQPGSNASAPPTQVFVDSGWATFD
mmetsp:Transcript_28388/g.53676  ORF Transcript_28388/g.53676 Transcript_28388/m.53676 type:complete len:308 (-) Transcript_28388:82-1005(-)